MLIADSAGAWTELIVALSIFVPVVAAIALTVWVVRGARDDPDEQRWRRLEAERLRDTEVDGHVDVGQ